jgi:hypothetical protein
MTPQKVVCFTSVLEVVCIFLNWDLLVLLSCEAFKVLKLAPTR